VAREETGVQHLGTALGQWDLTDLAGADDEMVRLFADRAARHDAFAHLVAGLSTAVAPWTGPAGVIRVDVDLADGGRESWTLRFGPGGVVAEPDLDAEPDVAIRLPLVELVRLATGQADGALLFLSGVLEITGDEELLLEIGSLLRTGSGRTLIDAAALDPVAVSMAIAEVSTAHLAAVMAGGFRDLVLAEVFRRLPEFVIAEKAERVNVAVAFEVAGRTDDAIDRFVVRIAEGTCSVIADAGAEERVDATLVLAGHEFLRLVLGHLNPVRAVLGGQLQVRGQVLKALGFNSVMRIPGREVLDR